MIKFYNWDQQDSPWLCQYYYILIKSNDNIGVISSSTHGAPWHNQAYHSVRMRLAPVKDITFLRYVDIRLGTRDIITCARVAPRAFQMDT